MQNPDSFLCSFVLRLYELLEELYLEKITYPAWIHDMTFSWIVTQTFYNEPQTWTNFLYKWLMIFDQTGWCNNHNSNFLMKSYLFLYIVKYKTK